MSITDYSVVLWLIPVVSQIVLPLVILTGWSVVKLVRPSRIRSAPPKAVPAAA